MLVAKPQRLGLAASVSQKLRRFSLIAGISMAVLLSVVVGAISFYVQAEHHSALLQAMRGNITALARNYDEREIERVLHSVVGTITGSSIRMVRDGEIRVAVPSIEETWTRYSVPKTIGVGDLEVGYDGSVYSRTELVDPVTNANFGTLIMRAPALVPAMNALMALVLSFALMLVLFSFWKRQTERIVSQEIRPLQQLHADLANVGAGRAPQMAPEDFGIEELADISSLAHKQHRDIGELTNLAVKAEGDRRAKESVRALLHDLLNVYTAQSTLVQARIQIPDDELVAEHLARKWPSLNRQLHELLKNARHMEVETPEMITTDLGETLREGTKLGAAMKPEAVDLSLATGELRVKHDPSILKRAVANLVRNSIEEGASKVRVWVSQAPLAIHIEDNGPGIPKELVTKLFEGRVTSQKPNGSGMGFRTALRFVEFHKGRIVLEEPMPSAPGAHFRIELPQLEICS